MTERKPATLSPVVYNLIGSKYTRQYDCNGSRKFAKMLARRIRYNLSISRREVRRAVSIRGGVVITSAPRDLVDMLVLQTRNALDKRG